MFRLLAAVCCAALVPAMGGCEVLSDFEGRYAGSVVKGEFVRSCFPPDARAELRFDPNRALTTGGASDGSPNSLRVDGVFAETPLRIVPGLPNDQLGNYDFPGPRRVRNYILLARPVDGPLAGRDATVFVSLLDGGDVELRVLGSTAGAAEDCLDPDLPAETGTSTGEVEPGSSTYFGVFILRKD